MKIDLDHAQHESQCPNLVVVLLSDIKNYKISLNCLSFIHILCCYIMRMPEDTVFCDSQILALW